ncbi:MAG: glutathione S-transferase family protein [Deltaproteobacteria bacterium]|nr:glutathione S-transferase family protein [Deltaproteobacteria bacterium]
MIELYHNDMSVCAQKVRFALGEKALKWESHHLNLRAGDQQKPDYVKLNPNAVVPTLVNEGKVIIESTVINEYLDDAYPEPRLRPTDAAARARMRLWTKQLDESIHAATRTMSNAIAFRHQKLALGTEALKTLHEKIPDPKKRAESWENITKGVDSSYFAGAVRRFDKLLADMETSLREEPWLAGKEFSLADIGYAPYVLRLQDLQLQFLWDKRPHISTWFEQVAKRPGYKEAFDDWPNESYASLMKEKGVEVQPRIKAVLTSA